MSDLPRPTRIAHIGVAVHALDEILPFYRDVLGLPEVPLDNADGARIAGLEAGESLVELLEAQSPDSPIGKFVSKRGPGHASALNACTTSTPPSPAAGKKVSA